jgi:hypothetical protein
VRVRALVWLLLAAAGGVAAPGAAQGQGPAPQPLRADDFGGFIDVLPPGANDTANPLELGAFLTTGARPANSDDQLAMYGDLAYAVPGITQDDVGRYFKDASFGVRPGDVARTYEDEDAPTTLEDARFPYVDDNDIAYFNSGWNPRRPEGIDGQLPTPSRYAWEGYDPATGLADLTLRRASPAGQRPALHDELEQQAGPWLRGGRQQRLLLGLSLRHARPGDRRAHQGPAHEPPRDDRRRRAGRPHRPARVEGHVYGGDPQCESGNDVGFSAQMCFDAVLFRPTGGITQALIHWVNRPTYQQAVEVVGHRPR